MRTNAAGIALIKHFESLKLEAYYCPAGVLTIGYGHTGDVKPGDRITEHQADAILDVDLDKFERSVSRLIKTGLNENQFSALVSFCFNLGEAALARSALLRKTNAMDFARFDEKGVLTGGAAFEFGRWVFSKGRKLRGLVDRRAAETELFLRGVA